MHDVVGRDQLVAAPRRSLWARARRPLLMLLVPLLIVAGGAYYFLTAGRSVSTDNAYVAQDKVSISSDVTGRVVAVNVGESQQVHKGDVLFTIDPEPFRIALEQAQANLASARAQVVGHALDLHRQGRRRRGQARGGRAMPRSTSSGSRT